MAVDPNDMVGRFQRAAHRRLSNCRKLLRQMEVIPKRDRVLIEGNCRGLNELLDELEGLLS